MIKQGDIVSVDFNGEIRKVIVLDKGRFKGFFCGADFVKKFIVYHFHKDKIVKEEKDVRSDNKQKTYKIQRTIPDI